MGDQNKHNLGPVEAMLVSPFRASFNGDERACYNSGWNNSNRKKVELADYEIDSDSVDFGIHVYADMDNACYEDHAKKFPIDVFVPVTVHEEDFVCAGEESDAVFMKVFIEQEDFEKALVEGKNKLEALL